MENFKYVYVVISFGGEYDSSYENVECAFITKTMAKNWIENRKSIASSIGKEKFHDIERFIYEKEDEIYRNYYNEDTDTLKEGKTDNEYLSECNKFHDIQKYTFLKDNFNISKEEYDIACQIFDDNFCDYQIQKIKLYK